MREYRPPHYRYEPWYVNVGCGKFNPKNPWSNWLILAWKKDVENNNLLLDVVRMIPDYWKKEQKPVHRVIGGFGSIGGVSKGRKATLVHSQTHSSIGDCELVFEGRLKRVCEFMILNGIGPSTLYSFD